MPKKLEAKIIEIKDGRTLLEIENQKLTLSPDCLPEKIIVGTKLKLFFLSDEITAEKKVAKMVLEEILNGK